MQSIRKLTLWLVVLLMLTALLGGALAETAGSVILTDMKGREVTLSAPATRIVALSPADCEILYAIGAGATVVGRGEYCDYPAEVADVPSVQSGAETNIEQIVALQPQVVLMGTMAQTKEQTAALEAAGIQVVVSEAQDIAGVYTDIRMIGAVTGQTAAADALVAGMQDTFASIAAKATGDGTKTVYFEVSPLQWGLWTAGSGTFMDELASMLGLRNAFADVQSWAQISEEQVLARDPDYIVTVAMYFGEGPTPVEEISGRAGWQNLKAVRNEAIFNVDTNEISRPGPRLAQAAEMLYAFIYEPETLVPAA